MRSWPRRLLMALLPLLAVVLFLTVGISIWLATWIPTKGKAFLEAHASQALGFDVRIGSLRYHPFKQELAIEQFQVTDRQRPITWIAASHLRVALQPLWLLQRQMVGRIDGALTSPCPADITLAGRYRLRDQTWEMTVDTSAIDVNQLIPAAAALLPPALHGGLVRLNLRANRLSSTPPVIRGQLIGERLLWEQLPLRVRGNITLNLVTVVSAPQQHPPFTIEATALLEAGDAEGVPVVDRVQELSGTVRLTNAHITIERLRGRSWDTPWEAEGKIDLVPEVSMELLVRAPADIARLAAQWETHTRAWQLTGTAALRVRYRGQPAQWPQAELAADTTLQEIALSPRGWRHPIEHLNGRLSYDHLTNVLVSSEPVTFTFDGEPVRLDATLTDLTTTPRLVAEARMTEGRGSLTATWQPNAVMIEDGQLALRQSSLQVTGRISRSPDGASRLRVSGPLHLSDLAHLPWMPLNWVTAWQLEGIAHVQAEVVGPLTAWQRANLHGTLRADRLSVRNVPLEAVQAQLEQGGGRLTLYLTQALMAGGSLAGEGSLIYEPAPASFRVAIDMTRTNLSQLAQAIPAWRNRGIDGTASLHTIFMGRGNDRGALTGEGWVHAEGAHLAELPLLDRLLRGMFGALADRLGLSAMRTAQITTIAGQWQLARERISTQDLKLGGISGTEPVAIYARGSVGLDKTLDLVVEPDLSEQTVLSTSQVSSPSTAFLKALGGLERLRRLVGRHRLTGTIDKPDYRFEFSLEQLFGVTLPSAIEQLLSPSQ